MNDIKQCILLDLPHIHDERGNLNIIESCVNVPFAIERIYYLHGVPVATVRGAHAHKNLQQLLIPVSGSFDIEIDDGSSKKIFHLNKANQGLYICPMIWRELSNFSPNAVCLVLASEKYIESDYLRHYDEFKRHKELVR